MPLCIPKAARGESMAQGLVHITQIKARALCATV